MHYKIAKEMLQKCTCTLIVKSDNKIVLNDCINR